MTQRLVLYRPLVSSRLSQGWGENRACQMGDGRIIGTRTTCPKGTWPFYPTIGLHGHNGLDFPCWTGEPIFHAATFDGVMSTETDPSGGIGVNVVSLEPIKLLDGSTSYIKCRYWHLKAPVGHDGKIVKFGETIGLGNSTGASSANHLHFGIKKCDKNGRPLDPNNGYYGAFDPTPYMKMDTDAKTGAEFLRIPPPRLSEQERKDMLSKLTTLQQLLNALLEIKRRL